MMSDLTLSTLEELEEPEDLIEDIIEDEKARTGTPTQDEPQVETISIVTTYED
jgi:hypothetical protein